MVESILGELDRWLSVPAPPAAQAHAPGVGDCR
jgi:hypothetical protein